VPARAACGVRDAAATPDALAFCAWLAGAPPRAGGCAVRRGSASLCLSSSLTYTLLHRMPTAASLPRLAACLLPRACCALHAGRAAAFCAASAGADDGVALLATGMSPSSRRNHRRGVSLLGTCAPHAGTARERRRAALVASVLPCGMRTAACRFFSPLTIAVARHDICLTTAPWRQ